MFAKFILIVLAAGCGGLPFEGIETTSGGTAGSTIAKPPIPVGGSGGQPVSLLAGGTSGGAADASGGSDDTSGGLAGASEGAEPQLMCHSEASTCQCYSSGDGFGVGWLNLASCPASDFCASRCNATGCACVCFADRPSVDSFLAGLPSGEGEKVSECPTAK